MQVSLKILEVQKLYSIANYWEAADYIKLLNLFDYLEDGESKISELPVLLSIAIDNCEPNKAASILLKYKLADKLNAVQIKNLSLEMQNYRVAEEYPDISLHYDLYNINQLLHHAYHGIFPNTIATKFDIRIETDEKVTKEMILKGLFQGLSQRNLIKLRFEDQLNGRLTFPEAENVIWELHDNGNHVYSFITSNYWLRKEDVNLDKIVTNIALEITPNLVIV